MRTSRVCAAFLAVVVLMAIAPHVGLAQLTQSSGVAFEYGKSHDGVVLTLAGGPFEGVVTSGASPDAGRLTFNLKGDLNVTMPPAVTDVQQAYVNAFVQFQAGPLPVRVTPSFAAGYKLVNGGGTPAAPVTFGNAGFTLYESGGYDADAETPDSSLLGPSIFNANVGNLDAPIVGNGLKVIDGAADAMPSYILAAGVDYTLILGFNAITSTADLPLRSPTSVVTIEAGGISGWGGATVTMDYEVVPEPGATWLFAVAAVALGRRVRPARRRPGERSSAGAAGRH